MVLDNTSKAGTIAESISWYKADDVPQSFRIMKNKYYEVDSIVRARAKKKQEEEPNTDTKIVSVVAPK